MLIADHVIQILLVVHIHIKKSTTALTSGVIVPIMALIEAIGSAWKLPPCDFSKLTETVQIPVNRSFTDMRILLCNVFINLFSGCVLRNPA